METYWTRYGGRKNRIPGISLSHVAERAAHGDRAKAFETYFKFRNLFGIPGIVSFLYERTEALQLRDKMDFAGICRLIQ